MGNQHYNRVMARAGYNIDKITVTVHSLELDINRLSVDRIWYLRTSETPFLVSRARHILQDSLNLINHVTCLIVFGDLT